MCLVGVREWRRTGGRSEGTREIRPGRSHRKVPSAASRPQAADRHRYCPSDEPSSSSAPSRRTRFPASARAWLREIHPSARVLVIDDRYDENDSRVGGEHDAVARPRARRGFHIRGLRRSLCAAHGSDARIGGQRPRRVPISGTAVRHDPFAHWDFLEPPVRGWFAKRVCVLGAESTGTTTLAQALAERLAPPGSRNMDGRYPEEAGSRRPRLAHRGIPDDCRGAGAPRGRGRPRANRVLICDTNAFATVLWHRRYMGGRSSAVRRSPVAAAATSICSPEMKYHSSRTAYATASTSATKCTAGSRKPWSPSLPHGCSCAARTRRA